ncbi:TonB-dependent receptor [Aestuariirhabdus haliotis]|uniref:TonB-dependent receptor n=1 Tax=Aestuariirhabdus haliotis TaxID=2918751 RepID=UPI0020BF2370|nr:TonB-dependent receptor [Aestuariirhabdus haliotis]MCL6420585.1 TonB-dependent receptor [Aestuariirhabdus haliotis]
MFKLNKLYAAILLSGPLATGLVMAQEKSTEQAATDKETIVIKGQKIERSLQDTVESVSVYSGENLEDGNLTDFFDLTNKTANFTRNGSFSYSIRGVSSLGPAGGSTASRTISVVTDGATLTNRAAQARVISTWDMEQVEVLRGPQSTNQGRNALAGTVILKSKDPEFESSGQSKVTYGEYGTYQLAVAQTGAITDNLAFRIALDRQASDGFIDNQVLDDNEWSSVKTDTFRGKLLYQADNGSEWLFTVTDINYEEDGDDNILFDAYKRKAYDNYDSKRDTDVRNYILEGTIPLNSDFSLTSVTSYSNSNFFRDSDGDSFQTLTGDGTIGQDLDEYILSQDLRVNFEGDDLSAVVGIYVAKGESDGDVTSDGIDFTSAFESILGPLPAGSALLTTSGTSDEKFENYAAYFNADYQFASDWTLLTGLRVDYEERSSDNTNNVVHSEYGTGYGGVLPGPPFPTWGDALAFLNGSGKDEDDFLVFLPKVGLKYDITADMSVAATFQTGYRSGGVSTNLATGAATSYDEETTDNYELSLRSAWWDDRLIVNANLFYVDWKDMQVDVQLSAGNPYDTEIQNAGEAHLWGGEIESTLQATPEISFTASLGYVETEFDDFESTPENEGNEFAGAPDLTANFGATYRNYMGIFATGNISYVGDAYVQADNEIERDSYSLVNVKLGYEAADWSAYVFADNLLDRDYKLNEFTTQLPNNTRAYEVGAPRLVGIAANLYW